MPQSSFRIGVVIGSGGGGGGGGRDGEDASSQPAPLAKPLDVEADEDRQSPPVDAAENHADHEEDGHGEDKVAQGLIRKKIEKGDSDLFKRKREKEQSGNFKVSDREQMTIEKEREREIENLVLTLDSIHSNRRCRRRRRRFEASSTPLTLPSPKSLSPEA